ncbi:MAG: ABC-F family ATP-binding cassette domain-containing protein [Bacteroidaceae bacterium]|nr:ABC-F family ATP-binding cassette domain-containing protein [Bacteroidaceae bacterium]
MATPNPYLEVMALTKRIGERVLFHDISFTINEKEHVGLIAKNGTGKTTLLSIIAGKEGYDGGKIVMRNGLRVGYLEQTPTYEPLLTIRDACLGHDDDLKTKQILTKLKMTDYDMPFGQMSGGMIKRVALAQVLEQDPDLIILDEPTNHLDLEMIEWLEKYLANTTKSILMVTHDRYFLDRVCNSIIEMDDSTIYSYDGNYSYYLKKRQERIDNLNDEITRANNLYRTELEWMRRMPQARGHKAKYRQDAFYELEKVARQRITNEQVEIQTSASYIGSKIFEAYDLCKAFGDKVILKDFNYIFSRYEKMGIVGNNGAGKTTFIKLLLGEIPLDKGKISIGKTVRFGYYSQEGIQFRDNQKVIDAVRDIAEYVDLGNGQRLSASQFLQNFLFSPKEQYNYIEKLSGGERRRLYLCTVLMTSPNFLILDEPTNDLDIITLQILEEYLRSFKGCVIVVSHDRYFMDKVVDHVLVFHGDGQVQDFPGNYTQYREWKRERDEQQKATKGETDKSRQNAYREENQSNRKRRLTFKEKQEYQTLETEIDRLETEKASLEEALSSGLLSSDEIVEKSKRLNTVNSELDAKSDRWLELSEIADN